MPAQMCIVACCAQALDCLIGLGAGRPSASGSSWLSSTCLCVILRGLLAVTRLVARVGFTDLSISPLLGLLAVTQLVALIGDRDKGRGSAIS